MSDIAITERQQYWLDHIRASSAFDGTVSAALPAPFSVEPG
jgi:hypothetical protein